MEHESYRGSSVISLHWSKEHHEGDDVAYNYTQKKK